jgi:transketolase
VECYVALEFAIKNNTTPTTIILSRNVFENYDVECDKAKYGGYVIKDTEQHDINIIATGSELQTAFEVADLLTKNKIKSRIISFNSIELFEKQSRQYKESILDNKPTISIEFGSTAP